MSVNNTVTFSLVTALELLKARRTRTPASRADHRVLVWSGVVGWAAEGAAKTVTRFEVALFVALVSPPMSAGESTNTTNTPLPEP